MPEGPVKKLLAYADDTTFFPPDNTSILKILETFEDFGKGSDTKINVQKSSVMEIGNQIGKVDYPPDITQEQDESIWDQLPKQSNIPR
jgi:hypothetical protein